MGARIMFIILLDILTEDKNTRITIKFLLANTEDCGSTIFDINKIINKNKLNFLKVVNATFQSHCFNLFKSVRSL